MTGKVGPGQRALAFILVTIMLDMLAMSLVIPVLPRLVLSFMDHDTASASRVIGVFGASWALMQFIFSPIMGAVSDRFGRRPVILISNFGLGLDYILMAVAPGIGLLFIGRLISGITGASMSTAQAYITDVSPPEKRAANFGLMSVAFGLGFILGPALGGALGQINPRLPFWVAACLSLINAAYGIFVLPESLAREGRGRFSWRKANPLGAFELLVGAPGLLALASIHFLLWLSRMSLTSVFVLYASYRYAWSTVTIGLTFAAVGICSIIVGGFLVKPVVARIGERAALAAGLLCGGVGMFLLGFADSAPLFVVGLPVMSLMSLAAPSLLGLMTARIDETSQGQLQGALGSVTAIASMIGPLLFSFVFAQSISSTPFFHLRFPGAPFYLAAVLLGVATVAALRTTCVEERVAPLIASSGGS